MKEQTQTHDGKPLISFGMELTGATREERVRQFHKNLDDAEQAAREGKVIVLSDLICQAEQLHIEAIEQPRKRCKRKSRLEELLVAASSAADGYCELKAQGNDAEAQKIVDSL